MYDFSRAVYDILDSFIVGSNTHPSTKITALGDEFFASCVASQNWKPFVIGILAPDNPIDFVPIRRIKKEVPKAPMPPNVEAEKAKPKDKNTAKKDDKKGVVSLEKKPIQAKEWRDALIKGWVKKTGSPPPEHLLKYMFIQSYGNETGGIYRDPKSGTKKVKDTIHPPNYNMFGYHDVRAKPPTYKARRVGGPGQEVDKWVDDNGNEWGPNGEIIKNNGTIGVMRGSQLYFAPMSGESTLEFSHGEPGKSQAFYNAIGRSGTRFLGTDKENGGVYISSYTAFDSAQSSADNFTSYIHDIFPSAQEARSPEEYEHAIMNGVVQDGITRKFHDTSKKVRDEYTNGLRTGEEAYNNFFNNTETTSLSGTIGGSDATDDPNQRIMVYGASYTPDDPIATIYGRNIEVDEVRFKAIESQLHGIRTRLNILRSIPPLILFTNPQEFNRSYENSVDFSVKTRVGNIIHTHLEQPIKISASGVSAAQFAVDADFQGGLTNYNRIHSLSYRNLMSLVMLYKNNGSLYDYASGSGSQEWPYGSSAGDGSIILPGSIFIYYDEHLYIGSFDNFTITDSADKPYNMAYSFTFTVRHDMSVNF